jgi:phosphonate transport system ATP-binding protein
MELIANLAEELELPVLINLHNVAQAKHYASRIVGLRGGVMIFDGKPEDLTDDYLEKIYTGKDELSEQKHLETEKA